MIYKSNIENGKVNEERESKNKGKKESSKELLNSCGCREHNKKKAFQKAFPQRDKKIINRNKIK